MIPINMATEIAPQLQKKGYVIREVNRKPVRNVGNFVQKIEQAKAAVVSLPQSLPLFH